MSVSQYLGVVPRSELKGDEGRAESTENYKTSKPGQIVLNRMSAASGALGLATEYGLVSPDYAVLQPSNFVEPKYLYYLMKSDWFTGQMVARLKGIGAGGESASVRTPRVNISDLGDIEVNLPLIEEQRRIADFLDSQSSRIDKILVTKAQQIDLLKQEVQTSSAGFFGHPIFSGSETKESRRLGPCLLVNEGGYWGDDPTGENDTLVLRSTEISSRGKWRELSNGAYRSLNIEFGNKHLLQRDDILVTKASGSLDHIGKAALATEEIVSLGASFGNFMQRLRINREIFLPEYICHFLRSTNARAQFQYMGTTSTGLFNISAELLNDLQVPVVSLSEQHNIVKSLEELESRFEARVSLIEESIKLFEEFKLATISEAITGKSMFESLKGLVNV
jgi:type I restriction enzyme S subunit